MEALDSVATVPTIGFALGVAISTFFVRRVCELIWPTLSDKTAETTAQRVWERLALPFMPVVLGIIFSMAVGPKYFDYPMVALRSVLSRVIYGVVVGWFADFGYRALVFFLKKKWNVALPGASDAPGPTPEANKPVPLPPVVPPPEVKP